MSRTPEELLEFDALRALVRGHTTCAPGRRAVEALAPMHDAAALDFVFADIGEAMAWLRAGRELGFGALADPAGWLERLESPGAVLAPQELLDAASLIETAGSLKASFRDARQEFPRLAARAESLAGLHPVAAAIRRAVLPNGDIHDAASAALRRIRTAIGRTRETIHKALRELLRARGAEPGEDYITLRNDRFVIPVRASDRRSVRGVVHAASATGQTVFLEPLETLELNNQLVQLGEDEAAEIARILRELTERLQEALAPLRQIAAAIGDFDSLFARARFAREFGGTLPKFHAVAGLRLEGMRHPVLEASLRRQGRAIVPLSLALGGAEASETVLVISGPNTGGKTVALKTIGLAALAAQSGIPVAADEVVLPIFDRVLADIGDEQSISADLSTFSAHMLNLRAMLAAATPHSLVLVDEMGTGTAPEEGSALAVALLEEFRARRCLTLATTHHDRLKTYASTTPGVLNAAVEFDDVNLRPTYRLRVGVPGTSSGIAIAQRLGLPAGVISRARDALAPEALAAAGLIAWLHRTRDELEEIKRQAREELTHLEAERRALRTEWVERQRRRLAELEHRFTETLKHHEQEVRRLVAEVKDRELRAQLEKQAGRRVAKLRTEARDETNAAVVAHLGEAQRDLGPAHPPEPVSPDELVPGARVHVRGLAQPVVIRQKDARTAEVQAGPLRMKVQLSEITAIAHDLPTARSGPDVARRSASEPAPVGDTINVVGCTVEEATRQVDKFLDQAVLAAQPRLRIIHGHGTGALRRGLAEFLAGHPHVEGFTEAEPDHGGAGVTLVQLKT